MKHGKILASGLALAGIVALGSTATSAQAAVVTGPGASGIVAGNAAGPAPWTYRYVQAEVTLPDITSKTFQAAIPGGYGASVRLTDGSQTADLGISTTPGSGNYNAAFAQENSDGKTYGTGSCLNGNSPAVQPGDRVVLSLYYDYAAGKVYAAEQDLTTPAGSFSNVCSDPGQKFTNAQIVDGFAANDYAPASVGKVNGTHHLNTFTNTVITNRTGTRGSAGSAPWPVHRMIANGTSVTGTFGTGKASPDNVVRSGRDFSVYVG